MAEQKQKEKKKEKEDKKRSPFSKKTELRKPKVKDYICRMRAEGASYRQIREGLEEKFDITASDPTLKRVYKTETARATLNSPQMSDRFSAMGRELTKRYKRSLKIVDKLADMIDKLYDDYDKGEVDYMQVLKSSRKILSITKEIRKQLETLKEDQQDIKVSQKNMVYSPVQINMQLKKVFDKVNLCDECQRKVSNSIGQDEEEQND
ncbi:MAG: hypothetical protein ACOC5T_06325 [Elusimicrobiota bacterium]